MTDQALVDGEVAALELPKLDDIEHPILRRALERVHEMLKDDGAKSTHNRHHNRHDRGSSPYW